jgi:hypothetical protein
MSREDTLILAAATIYAGGGAWSTKVAVQQALAVEKEVIKQRKAQDNARALPTFDEFVAQIPPRLCGGTKGKYCAIHDSSLPHYLL